MVCGTLTLTSLLLLPTPAEAIRFPGVDDKVRVRLTLTRSVRVFAEGRVVAVTPSSFAVKLEWGVVYVSAAAWAEVGRVLERDGHTITPIEWTESRATRKDAITDGVREAVVKGVNESQLTNLSPLRRDIVTRSIGNGQRESRQALILLSTIEKLWAEYQARPGSYKLGRETFRGIVREDVWNLRKAFR